MAIRSKIRKQGGAAVMTIPPAQLKLMDLEVGVQVMLSVEHGKLVARLFGSGGKRYSLADGRRIRRAAPDLRSRSWDTRRPGLRSAIRFVVPTLPRGCAGAARYVDSLRKWGFGSILCE